MLRLIGTTRNVRETRQKTIRASNCLKFSCDLDSLVFLANTEMNWKWQDQFALGGHKSCSVVVVIKVPQNVNHSVENKTQCVDLPTTPLFPLNLCQSLGTKYVLMPRHKHDDETIRTKVIVFSFSYLLLVLSCPVSSRFILEELLRPPELLKRFEGFNQNNKWPPADWRMEKR